MNEIRPPLVLSLFPQGLEWLAVPNAFRHALSELPFRVQAVAGGISEGWFRHFRAENEVGERLFGTIVPKHVVESYRAADRLAHRAALSGLSTPLLIEAPHPLDSEHFLLLRPWISGRHGPNRNIDFAACGRALGLLHAALGDASPIEISATQARLELITSLRPAWEAWPTVDHPSSFQTLLDEWPRLAELAARNRTLCHGDIHAGNILFPPDGEPVFLDFEETPHSALNPMTDIARFFERFILVQTDQFGRDWGFQQARQFFQAYRQVQPLTQLTPICEALAFHHALSARICLSSGYASHTVWRLELEKVSQLMELSVKHRQLIVELDERLAASGPDTQANTDRPERF